MDKETTAATLMAFAQGNLPQSLNQAARAAFDHPEIIRALYSAAVHLTAKVPKDRSHLPENTGKPWEKEEEKLLEAAFQRGDDFCLIATNHGRTRSAITRRLERLGLLKPVATV